MAKLILFINILGPMVGVEPELIRAIITHESNWDANAVSPVGAKGLMQLMPIAIKDLRIRKKNLAPICKELNLIPPVTDEELFTAENNIVMGTCYLKLMLNEMDGDISNAVLSYHQGAGNVRAGRIGPEGRKYVKRVMRTYRELKEDR